MSFRVAVMGTRLFFIMLPIFFVLRQCESGNSHGQIVNAQLWKKMEGSSFIESLVIMKCAGFLIVACKK